MSTASTVLLAIPTATIVLLVILAILTIGIVVLYFVGRRLQKRQEEQKAQIAAASQSVSMLIIDKKKMKLKDAGLPAAVLEQMPKLMRRSKVPVVKAKIGPKITALICDAEIFDSVPVKKEVKATISGLYLTSVKGMHGPIAKDAPVKKGFRAMLRQKYNSLNSKSGKEKSK